jgi:hypothetical protein
VGVQPWLVPADYASTRTFAAALAPYFGLAGRLGWLSARTVVVLPEYLGAWLVVLGAPPAVYRARTIAGAMPWLIAGRWLAFPQALRAARSTDRVREAVFRSWAAPMARAYQAVFSRFAATYHVTIVAGSILLPEARVVDGVLRAGDGALQNVAAVYAPDGRAHARLARKVFPIDDEAPFLAAGRLEELPVFETPAGLLGVAICADSWSPEVYTTLQGRGAELLAVPSYLAPDGAWQQVWHGYNGRSTPSDVRPEDVWTHQRGRGLGTLRAGRASAGGRVSCGRQPIPARRALGPRRRWALGGDWRSGGSLGTRA